MALTMMMLKMSEQRGVDDDDDDDDDEMRCDDRIPPRREVTPYFLACTRFVNTKRHTNNL